MSAHQFQIARGVPSSLPRLSIGGRRSPLLASAATSSFDHDQRQRSTGTALGRRLVMYRSTLGVAKVHGRGLFPAARGYDLPDSHLAGAFTGAGPFPNLRSQPRRQAPADLLPSHFIASVRYAPTASELGDQKIGNPSQAGQR